MTAANMLFYIQLHWKDGYREFPNLKGLSPALAWQNCLRRTNAVRPGGGGIESSAGRDEVGISHGTLVAH
jgi:hypothetical protein